MKFKSRLPAFLLTGLFLLLSLFASSCFWAKTLPGEAYRGHHVYLMKDYGEAEPSGLCPSDREPMQYLKEIDDTFFLTRARGEDEGCRHEREYYRSLLKRGYYSDGTSSKGEKVSYVLAPGTLFRTDRLLFWEFENGGHIYATVLNGPLAGKEVYVSFGDDFRSHLTPFAYPAGETHPCWQGSGRYSTEFVLNPNLVEDLGELSDDELKEKGLWLEPGMDAALKAAMKPFPEGIGDEFVFDGVMGAAQNADVDAQLQLSQCYYEGAGVRKSRDNAERWLESAVNQTQRRDLEFRLALMYADAWRWSGIRSGKAEKIFRKYAEQGDKDAQFCLGLLLECGYGNVKFYLPVDQEKLEKWKESVEWYRKAAEQGDARAMRALGMAYCEPSETPWFWPTIVRVDRDMEQAAEWFRKAAELGDFAAQRNLGYLYLKGKGVEKDKAEARKWLEKASAQGDAYAAELLNEIK